LDSGVEGGGGTLSKTARERGQLKYLERYLENRTQTVIAYALKNCESFAREASCDSGVRSWPHAPHIGFLLKHHAVAVNMTEQEAEQAARQRREETTLAAASAVARKPLPKPAANVDSDRFQMTDDVYAQMVADLDR
jgi:hypothetical protein